MVPFKVTAPTSGSVPIIISVPHCGIRFPDDLREQFDPQLVKAPDDTDWFVDRLYDFAPAMGMTMISAVYSRWVIDLNRHPESKPLYADGRIITGLCPTTNFLGVPLYKDRRAAIDHAEVNARLEEYYWPYHRKISELLTEVKTRHGKVLLWDCHSIRQVVTTIQQEKFPDLILGSADETSASPTLIASAVGTLSRGSYSFKHNHPFKGGFITRDFGKPNEGMHALQLEMTKVNYMDDAENEYDPIRAERMRELLKRTFDEIIQKVVQ